MPDDDQTPCEKYSRECTDPSTGKTCTYLVAGVCAYFEKDIAGQLAGPFKGLI